MSRWTVWLVILLCAGNIPFLRAQEPVEQTRAMEDLRFLLDVLEETHPDPYSAYGGKVEFKRKAQALLSGIPAEGLTSEGIYELVRPFLSELRDGHTGLVSPSTSSEQTGSRDPRYLPVRFGIAMDAVFITRAVAPFDELIGYRVLAVQGVAIEEVKLRAAQVFPAENDFGAARSLVWVLRSDRYARRLFVEADGRLTMELSSPDGSRMMRSIPFRMTGREYREAQWVGKRWEGMVQDSAPFSWQLLELENVGYLKVQAMEGREAYEEARSADRQDLEHWVTRYYGRYMSEPVPEGMNAALGAIPCFTRTVDDLLTAMKEVDSEYLIVDLRQNGGGFASLATPFYLLAYGNEYLDYEFPDLWATVISPRYLEIFGTTIEDLNEDWGTSYQVGDYHLQRPASASESTDLEEYSVGLGRFRCSLAERVLALGGEPLYRPKNVIVLVNPMTFSAGYTFLYRLWHLGATILGVPSAQSPNAFTDATPVKLPSSKLEGWMARSAQVFFPGDWEKGRLHVPDFPMNWEHFGRYQFDAESEVLYALELIASGAIGDAQRK
ncbi:MAG: hypothetical protein AMS21_07340 [Gemmatimonas sp. SG8_38_2]|nr:MAG: hypothetical protein AMS21_07340 [Gemmatimonas sp. SG8_38_2]